MANTRTPLDPTIEEALIDFARDLRVDKSPKTIATYSEAVRSYQAWAASHAIERLSQITTTSVREWLVSLRESGRSSSTVFNRHAGFRSFMRWCIEEMLLEDNPVSSISPPPIAEVPVPVLRPEQLKALLKTTDGPGFDEVRDAAMLRLLIDTGMRRKECAGLSTADIDLDQDVAVVLGKGNRIRGCPFGVRTAKALRRYLRIRAIHAHADSPKLWLGRRGPLGDEAIRFVVKRRARQAGIDERVFVHQLRHTWAHEALQRMNESDVQRLGGWRARDMLARYGASGADERARNAYRQHSLGDRL